MSEISTPPRLSQPPDDVSPWLAYYIGQIHSTVKTIQTNVATLTINQTGILARMGAVEKKIAVNNKPNNPNSSTVTFKWLMEKLALPVIMLGIGAVAAHLYGG